VHFQILSGVSVHLEQSQLVLITLIVSPEHSGEACWLVETKDWAAVPDQVKAAHLDQAGKNKNMES